MALYEYEKNLSDLTNKYQNDTATNQYARFISQQRFGRQRQDADQGFQRSFPRFTSSYAARGVNGHVQSGVMRQDLNNYVGDYNQSLGRMDEDQAGYESNWQNQQSNMGNQYQQALLSLQEELQRQRALQDPYSALAPIQGGQ